MYPLPADVQAAIATGAQMGGHVDVLRAGDTILTIPIVSGSVTVDRAATSRRTGKVVIVDPTGDWTPKSTTDPLAANGNEIRVWYDIYLPGGSVFGIPMATLTIVTTTVEDSGVDYTITVEGSDRSWDFLQRKFVQPYTVAADQPVDQAIMDMLNSAWSGNGTLPFNLALTTAVTPSPAGVIQQNKDPWTNATLLANNAGMELYPDALGAIVGRPTPDPTTQPTVWQLEEVDNGSLKAAKRVFTRDGVYSAFEVVGTGSATVVDANGKTATKSVPILSYVEDDDPASPTYAQGPFGVVPDVQRSTMVTSQAQGDAMVATQLQQRLGAMDALQLTVVPNPALDVDDVVFVSRSRLGVAGLFVVDSITCDLTYEAEMSVALRTVQ